MNAFCKICGNLGEGQPFTAWVKDTFTNYDLLFPGEIICNDCLFWFDQRSEQLQQLMNKDKPQKMQNYSHFVLDGQWVPVSKGNKSEMARLLLSSSFPEMAAIAVSGQKHIAFRARRNQPGQTSGWVQFEEQQAWVEPEQLSALLTIVEQLYNVFSKGEIESGNYYPKRILQFGMEPWYDLEQQIKPIRGTILFQLAIYLAQRSDDGSGQRDGSTAANHDLETDTGGLQESLPHDDLDSVRERDSLGGLHQQPGKVHQLNLFATEG